MAQASTPPSKDDPNPAASADSRPIRVIVADDSSSIRLLARHILSAKRGFRVVAEATDGAEALRVLDTHETDCLVLDAEMPGLGGFETLVEVRHRFPALPVVMLSGHSGAAVSERALLGGAAAYLDKGRGLRPLVDTIREVMHDATAAGPEIRDRA